MEALIIFGAKYLLAVPLLLAVTVWLRANTPTKHLLVWRAITAILIAVLLTFIAGAVHPETRPYIAKGIAPLITHAPTDNSFPSDHTITTFTASLVILPFAPVVGIISLVASLLVGISRVAAHVHWPIDIVGGIAIAVIATGISAVIFKRPPS